jgi:tetratricopeptide (TPR) repeat protein
MKTYRNEQLGFEIDIPEQWSYYGTINGPGHAPGREYKLIFKCEPIENFTVQIEPLIGTMLIQPPLDQKENVLRQYAHENGYTDLGLGRFTVEGKEHFWARYYEGYGHWTKKFMVVLGGTEYTIIATCLDQKFLLQMEKVWDQVVNSFRLLPSAGKTTQSQSERMEQKGGIAAKQGAESGNEASQASVHKKLAGLKTYLNEKHGFTIDIPETWSPPPGLLDALRGPIPPGLDKDCFQYGCYDEALNFEIGPLYPAPLLEDTVIEFKLYAQVHGFTDLRFGRISVAGKQHVCASYFINDPVGPRWNKKYMLVFGGIEYALTCTCNDPEWFAKREKDWDAIIQSFHVLVAIDDSANATAKADRDRQQRRGLIQDRIEMMRDPGKIYARAYQAMALGQYLEARALLEEYLRNKPDHTQAHKDLAAVLQRLGDIAGAIRHLGEVERLDPSDSANRSKLARLVAESGSRGQLFREAVPAANTERSSPRPENSSPGPRLGQGVKDRTKRDYTLAFSFVSYLLVAILAFLFIYSRVVGFRNLLFLTSAAHQPLSTSEYDALSVMLFMGIGALICLISLLGVAQIAASPNSTSTIFGFIERTMRTPDHGKRTLGGSLFSDFTRKPRGIFDALLLQVMNFIRAVLKILMIFSSVGLLHPVISLIVAILFFGPLLIWHRPEPILWQAGTAVFWFYCSYRAVLFWLAKKEGVDREGDATNSYRMPSSPSLDSSIQLAMANGVTPEFVTKILCQKSIIQAIKNDLTKTDQIGYKEMWQLGLITPDQDRYDLSLDELSRQDRVKKFFTDANARANSRHQIPLKRTAVLYSATYFNVQFHNVLITNGKIKQTSHRLSNYYLNTILNNGEYIRMKNIQIDTNRRSAQNRSPSLTDFLREDGFPLKEFYSDGDPMSTDRGGIIVIDKGKILITHPKYFAQRRLIDDEGNLVDIGIDEHFNLGGIVEVTMQPAVLSSLVQYATSHGYIPILRYHSVPYQSDFMLPILDVPISANGWADLFIDPGGKAKLFIAKDKTRAEWVEMMNKLKQLFFDELAKNHHHILGFTKDRNHLSSYLFKKMTILEDYYIIQDWGLF